MKFKDLSPAEKGLLIKKLSQGGYLNNVPAGQLMSTVGNMYDDGGTISYTVKDGETLIGILRNMGLTDSEMINKVMKMNGISDPNNIKTNQTIILPESEFFEYLPAASISAKKQDYSTLPFAQLPNTRMYDENGNISQYGYTDRVMAYAQALKDKKLTIDQIPEQYKQQAFNQYTRESINAFTPWATNILLSPAVVADKLARGSANKIRKGIARISGTSKNTIDNDYNFNDYFGHFSMTGKKFEKEHPNLAMTIDLAATPLAMKGAANTVARFMDNTFTNIGNKLFSNFKETAKAFGITEQEVPRAAERTVVRKNSGVKYTGSTTAKGNGKTGTVTRGSNGYSMNSSYKGAYGNQASYIPKEEFKHITPKVAILPQDDFVNTGYWHGMYIPTIEQTKIPYTIVTPEKTHIEEVVPTQSKWITSTERPKVQIPYKPEYENAKYITAEAPIGNSVLDQPIIKESIILHQGNAGRSANEVYGNVPQGSPSGYYSGYGYLYGTEGGPWIIDPKAFGGNLFAPGGQLDKVFLPKPFSYSQIPAVRYSNGGNLFENGGTSSIINSPHYNSNAETPMYNYLRDRGLNHQQASGILGNLAVESYLKHDMQQIGGPAYGLMQAENPRKEAVKNHEYVYQFGSGLNSEEQKQLDYIIDKGMDVYTSGEWGRKNFKGARDARKAFLNTEDTKDATDIISNNYLRPGKPQLSRREAMAEYYDKKFSKSLSNILEENTKKLSKNLNIKSKK